MQGYVSFWLYLVIRVVQDECAQVLPWHKSLSISGSKETQRALEDSCFKAQPHFLYNPVILLITYTGGVPRSLFRKVRGASM